MENNLKLDLQHFDFTHSRHAHAAGDDTIDTLALLAHELRTPLTVIRGYASILNGPGVSESERAEYASTIRGAVDMMGLLLENLIEDARNGSAPVVPHKTSFDLTALFQEVRDLFGPLSSRRQVTLSFEAQDMCMLYADREKVRLILHNLVSNALKYVPAGGRVAVSAIRCNNSIAVSVTDNGPGISRDLLPRLFQRFSRGVAEGSGSGLGLFITKQLVESHGGTLDVHSIENRGSTFSFTLPLHEQAPVRPRRYRVTKHTSDQPSRSSMHNYSNG